MSEQSLDEGKKDHEATHSDRASFLSLFRRLPDDFQQASAAVRALRHQFHEEMAAALAPRLNAYLKTLPHETLADKQAVATWVNNELHQLGLTIRCPKTGNAAILFADFKNPEHEDISRYRIESKDARGKKIRSTSRELPELELMEDPPRREALSRKFKKPTDEHDHGR
jgi:hypothetical protein